MRAAKLLPQAELDRLKVRVGEVERATGAELVIIVANASGRYDRSESVVGAITAALLLVGADASAQMRDLPGAELWLQALAVGLGLVGGSALATVVPSLRTPFVGATERDEEVRRAALAWYADKAVGETSHGAGVLLYVSLFERQLEVIADSAVQAVAPDLEARCVGAVGAALKRGQGAAFVDALLDEVARQLTGKLPARPATDNQLDDAIILC